MPGSFLLRLHFHFFELRFLFYVLATPVWRSVAGTRSTSEIEDRHRCEISAKKKAGPLVTIDGFHYHHQPHEEVQQSPKGPAGKNALLHNLFSEAKFIVRVDSYCHIYHRADRYKPRLSAHR